MHGNVWEWTEDYRGGVYSNDSQIDPQGPATGSDHLFRGGGFANDIWHTRSANRGFPEAGYRRFLVGARLLRTR